jgi:hypothetical protein
MRYLRGIVILKRRQIALVETAFCTELNHAPSTVIDKLPLKLSFPSLDNTACVFTWRIHHHNAKTFLGNPRYRIGIAQTFSYFRRNRAQNSMLNVSLREVAHAL